MELRYRYICAVLMISLIFCPMQAAAMQHSGAAVVHYAAVTEQAGGLGEAVEGRAGGWNKKDGYWYFVTADGSNASGWLKDGEAWYFFNSNGRMATGWLSTGGKWYYLLNSGRMATGWLSLDGKWYYMKQDGSMFSNGWLEHKGNHYYISASGAMATGFLKQDGKTYFLDPGSGAMSKGKVNYNGKLYYMRSNGVMATGWVLDGGKWYYMRDGDGMMPAGSNKALFTFGADGAMHSAYPAEKARKIDPTKPMVALTFDDGPSKHTPQILATLDKYNARATFFMVGDRVKAYAGAAKQVVSQGSEIGSHTWDHKNLTTLNTAGIRQQLVDSSNAIYSVAGVRPIAVRPPYGSYNGTVTGVCKEQGMIIVNWSVDTLDWKLLNADAVTNEIMRTVKPGCIILCHDLHGTTASAMEKVVPRLINKGYQLVTISELLTFSGMHPGSVYNGKR